MKGMYLQQNKKYNQVTGHDGKELFDVSERRNMQIKSHIPVKMINFKNKSELKRYMRIANCIISLNEH